MTRSSKSAMPGGAPSLRQQRVGEEIRHALAEILLRGELRDPVLSAASITVSEVSVSPDLKNATVFVMPLGGKSTSEVLAARRFSCAANWPGLSACGMSHSCASAPTAVLTPLTASNRFFAARKWPAI